MQHLFKVRQARPVETPVLFYNHWFNLFSCRDYRGHPPLNGSPMWEEKKYCNNIVVEKGAIHFAWSTLCHIYCKNIVVEKGAIHFAWSTLCHNQYSTGSCDPTIKAWTLGRGVLIILCLIGVGKRFSAPSPIGEMTRGFYICIIYPSVWLVLGFSIPEETGGSSEPFKWWIGKVETGGNPMARDVTVTRFGKLTRGFYLSIW